MGSMKQKEQTRAAGEPGPTAAPQSPGDKSSGNDKLQPTASSSDGPSTSSQQRPSV